MIALAALCGATFGGGVWLIVLGLRGPEPGGVRRWSRPHADGRILVRVAFSVAGFLAGWVVTGWPMGAVMTAALAAYLPAVLGGKAAREAQLAKIEAIATWTEMVRDTVAAGSGISEAIRATAPIAPGPLREPVQRLTLRMDRDDHGTALRTFGNEV